MEKLACSLFLAFGVLRSFAADIDPALPKCPPDWKVEVIAQKPLLKYPSVVCAAPDGRIFVGQDPMDMPARGDVAIDSILCFHPDGHVTLFATNLFAVFGLAYVDGKLYVHHKRVINGSVRAVLERPSQCSGSP